MAWGTAGLITNPVNGQILADTGALAAVAFTPALMCYSDTPCLITLRHRNALNTADLHTQQLALGTYGSNFRIFALTASITLLLNERLTLTLDNGFTGNIQCSIITG